VTGGLAAEVDPNLANHYPAYAEPVGATPHSSFQSSSARLNTGKDTGRPDQEINQHDRASSPYAGGVG
jgi:hypothetical protein